MKYRLKNLKYGALIGLSMIGGSCKLQRNIMPERDGDIIARNNKTLFVPIGTRDTTEINDIPAKGKYLLTKYINNKTYIEIPYIDGVRHGAGRGFVNGNLYATATYKNNHLMSCRDKSGNKNPNIPLKIYFYDGIFTEKSAIKVKDFKYVIWPSDFDNDLYVTYKTKHDEDIRDDKFRVITKTHKYTLDDYTPKLREFIKKSQGFMDRITKNFYGYYFDLLCVYHHENGEISHISHSGASLDAVYSFTINIYNDERPGEVIFTVRYKNKTDEQNTVIQKYYFDDNFKIMDNELKPFNGKIIIGKVIMDIENGEPTHGVANWFPGEYSVAYFVDGVVHESVRRYKQDGVSYIINRYSKTMHEK